LTVKGLLHFIFLNKVETLLFPVQPPFQWTDWMIASVSGVSEKESGDLEILQSPT